MWWLIIPALIIIFLAVLVIRALMFNPKKQEKKQAEEIVFNKEKAVEDLRQMVMCKTVSNINSELEDKTEFEKFKKLLIDNFPNINKTCSLTYMGKSGILYHWKGKTDKDPAILMSHYDVVPVT